MRYFISISIFIASVWTFSAQCNDLRAMLSSNNAKGLILKEGDSFEGKIEIMPVESFETEKMKSLIMDDEFSENLQIVDIISISPSEHNADVLELKVRMVVKKGTDNEQVTIKIQDHLMPLELHDIKMLPGSTVAAEQFTIVAQPYFWNGPLSTSALVLMTIVSAIFIFISFKLSSRYLKKRREENRIKILRKTWVDTFKSANERKDFEMIYLRRDIWGELVPNGSHAVENFSNHIRPHLYRPEWGDKEIKDVRIALEEVNSLIGKKS